MLRFVLLTGLVLLFLPLSAAAQEEDSRVQGELKWDNKLTAGLAMTSGNSELFNLSAGVSINRNRLWVNEYDFKLSLDWRTDQGRQTYLLVNGMFRYGHSFTRKAYGFMGINGLSDYASLILYHIYPNLGVGYWFFDTKKIKIMNELGAGYAYYRYRDQSLSESFTLYYRFFIEWKLSENLTLTDSFRIRPFIPEFDDFLINNQAVLKFSLQKNLSLILTHQLNYDFVPAPGAEQLDMNLTTGLEWKF